MQNPLLEAALAYAARGWPVLPLHTWTGRCSCGDDQCSSPAKHPRTGHGLQDASTDVRVLEEWWRRWPDSNVGVRCDRLCVLDLDGPGAAIALGEHDLDPDLHPCTSQTGVGRHLLFAFEPSARPRTKVLPDLDVRAGAGSYIVAPPSVHWTGAVYEWKQEGEPPQLPATIRVVLGFGEGGGPQATVRDPGPSNGAHDPPVSSSPQTVVTEALAEARARGLLGVGEGGRHDTLLRLVGRQLAVGLMDLPELLAFAILWAGQCSPPYPREQALRDASDIWARHAAQHGGDPVFDYGEGQVAQPSRGWEFPSDFEGFLLERPPVRRWLLRWPDRDGKPCVPREGDGMLARGRVGMLTAEGGAGKTAALIQLGMCVLTGKPWFGHFHTPAPWGAESGKVCLLLAEEDRDEVWRRAHAIGTAMQLSPDEIEMVGKGMVALPLAGEVLHLLTQAGHGGAINETYEFRMLRDQLRLEAGEHGWALIGIDPLARVAGIDAEGDNTLATRLVQAVETLVTLPGEPAVMIAAHSSKLARRGEAFGTGEADARGVTGLTDGVRWHATLTRRLAQVEFRQRKSNYSRPMADPLVLAWRHGMLVADPKIEETVASALAEGMRRVVEALREMGGRAASANSLAAAITGKRHVVLAWIAEAAVRGLVVAVPGPRRSCGYVLPDGEPKS